MNGTSLKSKSKLRRRDKMNLVVVRRMIVGIAVLVVMVLFSACAGVGANGVSLSGSVVSVDSTNHTVTLSVNGQNTTIKNVPDNVITLLQAQVGKAYSFQVTQNSDGSYNIESRTNVTPEPGEGTQKRIRPPAPTSQAVS